MGFLTIFAHIYVRFGQEEKGRMAETAEIAEMAETLRNKILFIINPPT